MARVSEELVAKLDDVVERGDLEELQSMVEAGLSLQTRVGHFHSTLAQVSAGYLSMLQWIVEREPSLLRATDSVRGCG